MGASIAMVVAALQGAATPPAAAEENQPTYVVGTRLYELCVTGIYEQTCQGYVLGALDREGFASGSNRPADAAICLPEGTRPARLQEVVTAYLRAHPEQRHYAASDLVLDALEAAFPCRPARA